MVLFCLLARVPWTVLTTRAAYNIAAETSEVETNAEKVSGEVKTEMCEE